MKNLLARFVKDESGATAIEYALIAAGIGIAIITAVNALGTAISDKFNCIKGSLQVSACRSVRQAKGFGRTRSLFLLAFSVAGSPDAVLDLAIVHHSRLAWRYALVRPRAGLSSSDGHDPRSSFVSCCFPR